MDIPTNVLVVKFVVRNKKKITLYLVAKYK